MSGATGGECPNCHAPYIGESVYCPDCTARFAPRPAAGPGEKPCHWCGHPSPGGRYHPACDRERAADARDPENPYRHTGPLRHYNARLDEEARP